MDQLISVYGMVATNSDFEYMRKLWNIADNRPISTNQAMVRHKYNSLPLVFRNSAKITLDTDCHVNETSDENLLPAQFHSQKKVVI